MKKCFRCNLKKELCNFYAHKKMADGHLGKCKTCTKKDVFRHRQDNLERVQAYDRLRGLLPHRLKANKQRNQNLSPRAKNVRLQQGKIWIQNNLEKRAAGLLLNSAVASKKISKPHTCSECFSIGKIQGHHENYLEPLDVIWLCQTCHKKRHLKYPRSL